MINEEFSNLSLIHIEINISKNINPEDVINI